MFCNMKKVMLKIRKMNINNQVFSVICLLILLLSLVPVYRLAMYSVPFYDDFSYGNSVKNFYEQYGFFGIFKGMAYTVKTMWYAWQGTYSSIALMSMSPLVFGEQFYYLGVWVVISMITLGAFLLPFSICKRVLKATNSEAIIVSSIFCLFEEQFIFTSFHGIFWYNAAVHYTFMHGAMFLYIASLICLITSKKVNGKISFIIVSGILALLCAGANFITALQGSLFLGLILVLAFVYEKRRCILLLPTIVVYGIGLAFNVCAPGNKVRSSNFYGMEPMEAIMNSFKEGFIALPKLTGISSLLVLAIAIPCLWNMLKKIEFDFRLPGVITIFLFCLYATGYTPSLYGAGDLQITRAWVPVKFTYQFLLVICISYWIGWLQRKVKKFNSVKLNNNFVFCVMIALLFVLSFSVSKDQAGGYLSYGSYYYVHTGEAHEFNRIYMDRIKTLKTTDESIVGFTEIPFRPWLLIGNAELDDDINAEQNRAMSDYYGKEGVYLIRN